MRHGHFLATGLCFSPKCHPEAQRRALRDGVGEGYAPLPIWKTRKSDGVAEPIPRSARNDTAFKQSSSHGCEFASPLFIRRDLVFMLHGHADFVQSLQQAGASERVNFKVCQEAVVR